MALFRGMSRHEVGTEEKSWKGFVELLGCLYRSVTSQTSDGEEAWFRCEGNRGSWLGTGAGESKSNSGKTEEVVQ